MKQIFAVFFVMILAGCVSRQQPVPVAPAGMPPAPTNYQDIVISGAKQVLIDPDSAKFRFIGSTQPCTARYANTTVAYKRGIVGVTKQGQCGVVWVNAKNKFGGYTGERPNLFILDGNSLILFDEVHLFDYDRKPW
jgi:hypothetical protein